MSAAVNAVVAATNKEKDAIVQEEAKQQKEQQIFDAKMVELQKMVQKQIDTDKEQLKQPYYFIPKSEYSSGDIMCFPNSCFSQANFNRENAYNELKLSIVAGSLGIGIGKKPFFEYGDANYKVYNDFAKSPFTKLDGATGRYQWDAHVWLEDESGYIYDVLTDYVVGFCTDLHGKTIDKVFKCERTGQGRVIEKRTAKELRRLGMHYIKADGDFLIKIMSKHLRPKYDALLRCVHADLYRGV